MTDRPVPEGWTVAKIADLATLRVERAPEGLNGNFPYVALEHFTSGSPRLQEVGKASDATSEKSRFRHGDILYGKLRPALRKVVRADFEGCCSSEVLPIKAKDSADESFLYHIISSGQMFGYVLRGVAGTKMPRTSWNHLKSFEFPCPPPAERQAIAAVLDSMDEAIERTEEVIAATEELRKALLQDLLTHGVPGWHKEWKHVPGIGTIPADWEVVRLREVCAPPQYGAGAASVQASTQLPRYVRITDITDDGELSDTDVRGAALDDPGPYTLEDGDLLFARSGATVGKSYLYRKSDGWCVFAGYLIRFRATRDRALPEFLAAYMKSSAYERWVQSVLHAGAQPNINAQEYAALQVPLPPLDEQRVIAETTETIRGRVAREKAFLGQLIALKAASSAALLTGQVRVPAVKEVHP